ncbi:diguanylate cyclase [Blastococcus brunescens]|uniref:Diguanylate cyclase n=1 Tax=Blastococcus brunescens TaxID=1564165 RepID=A0ABZ1B281_9ACTN|nr:diguanylate cyclase [Blastococcus sp. BMG 8361]WRL64920.1 diguanylate cyclase [Blastococcus sp. BMG 8361]
MTGVSEAAEVLARAVQCLAGTDRSAAYLVDDQGRIGEVRHIDWPDAHKEVVQTRLVGRPAADVALWRLTAEQKLPVFVEDATSSDLLDPRLATALDLASYVSVPLLSGDRLLGLVVTGSTGETRGWPSAVREAVRQVTLEGSLVVENAGLRAVEKLRLEQLATEAHHDPLTGLANRRRFVEQLEATVYRADDPDCAVLMIDLDRFKEINDSFGHSVGDDLLCLVGPRLERALQPGDLLARMGGDEFAVLLPDAGATRADDVAERLGAALRDAFVLDGMPLHVDASIGIALCPDHGRDRSLLLARADTAMYVAKRGRRGFETWAPDGTPTPATGWRPWSSCAAPWTATSWTCTTSPRWTSGPAASSGSRRSCAGTTPSAGCSTPTCSCPSPSRRDSCGGWPCACWSGRSATCGPGGTAGSTCPSPSTCRCPTSRTSPCRTRSRCCSTPSTCRPPRSSWRSPRTSSWPMPRAASR